jgi:hypothetical protein
VRRLATAVAGSALVASLSLPAFATDNGSARSACAAPESQRSSDVTVFRGGQNPATVVVGPADETDRAAVDQVWNEASTGAAAGAFSYAAVRYTQ